MDDLLERLRRRLTMSMFARGSDIYAEQRKIMHEAADRIERLEAAMRRTSKWLDCDPEYLETLPPEEVENIRTHKAMIDAALEGK